RDPVASWVSPVLVAPDIIVVVDVKPDGITRLDRNASLKISNGIAGIGIKWYLTLVIINAPVQHLTPDVGRPSNRKYIGYATGAAVNVFAPIGQLGNLVFVEGDIEIGAPL